MNNHAFPVEKKQKLSTREWCLIIAILSLVQFFIHWVSYQFGGSPNALGYVSFAGTLVSIMLGLIAIIYSFVQSISQSTSVVEIREQVERLIVAGNEISESGKIIHSASQEVNGLVGDLASKVIENTSANKEVLGSVSKLTSELNFSPSMHERKISGVIAGSDGSDGSDDRISIVNSERIVVFLMVLCIYEGAKRGYTVDQVENLILPGLAKKIDVDVNFLIGAFNSVLFALEAEGYVEFGGKDIGSEVIEIADSFSDQVKGKIPDSMNGDNKYLNKFWQTVNELDSVKPESEEGSRPVVD